MAATIDVLVGTEKKGVAFDVNPVEVSTDAQCKELLLKLGRKLKLTSEQRDLLDQCITVVSAKDGDDVSFGPGEIFGLSELAVANPTFAPELMACSQHLSESVDCEGELPPDIFLQAAAAYGSLSNVMAAALKSGPIIPGVAPILSDDVSDDDFEEPVSDDDQ